MTTPAPRAGAGVRIDVELDDRDLRRRLAAYAARAGDLRPVLDEIGQYLVAATIRRFETETDPEGAPWPPSARAEGEDRRTLSAAARRAGVSPLRGRTLTDTGRLRASITHVLDRDSVSVGTNVVYAAIHQFGGTTGPRIIRARNKKSLAFQAGGRTVFRRSVRHPGSRVPRRAFLGVSDRNRARLARAFRRHLEGAGG